MSERDRPPPYEIHVDSVDYLHVELQIPFPLLSSSKVWICWRYDRISPNRLISGRWQPMMFGGGARRVAAGGRCDEDRWRKEDGGCRLETSAAAAAAACDWEVASGEVEERIGFLKKNSSDHKGHDKGLSDEDRYLECMKRSCEIVLIKTIKEIEGKYVDYMSKLFGKEVVPVGGLLNEPKDKIEDTKIMEWLNKRECKDFSFVFVSFGSEYFLSKEEIDEVAKGLERNKDLRFIWVVRFPPDQGEKISLQEVLPEGFLERVKGRGLVVDGWAPQGEILRSSRIGGFVSHCGWSSVIEAVVCGVPIVAMPMQLDQPWNAKLVEEIGVGIEVKGKKKKKIDGEEMGKVIDEVLVNGEVRNRVRELTEKLKANCDVEIDVVVEKLRKLIEGVV
ncbi:Flavanone 7-O-glucoside 2''-O-beta-L-rhamnosyltransferase [Linum perenne]